MPDPETLQEQSEQRETAGSATAKPEPGDASAPAIAVAPASDEARPTEKLATAPTTVSPVAGEERYDYERTTIVFVAQLRPLKEAGRPREVVLSVNNGVGNIHDFPLMRILTEEDDLVAAAREMLAQLQQELPERKARFLSKRVYRPAPAPASSPESRAHPRPAPATHTTAKQAPPPVPATAKPIPREELAMSGLFDGLQP